MKKPIGLLLVLVGVALSTGAASRLSPPEAEAARLEGKVKLAEAAATEPVFVGPGERLGRWFGVAGLPFLGGLVLVVGGAILTRMAEREALTAPDPSQEGPGAVDFGALLAELQADVAALAAEAPGLGPAALEALPPRIEALQLEKVERLVAAGPRLQLRHGQTGFAAVFSPLSGAERRLNRAWSAAVDGHAPETADSLAASAAGFAEAATALASLGRTGAG